MENNHSTTESRYQVIKKIGHGGMATVYLAFDRILNRQVAIKLLNQDSIAKDPSALKRFNIEAHAITSLIHPNIVEVYDICDIANKHFIVMEYVEGHSLKQIVQLRGALPYKEAVWIMKQLCSGIMEAHKNNIIHRDIKPQNILVKNDGTAKIADFGIAVLNNSYELTSKDTILGSVHYLAPELSKGETPTMQSDIYSLGIVFFELITGHVPYSGDSAVAIALKHFKEPLPDIKKYRNDIPQSIINIIIKATAKDINERYENIALMLKDINDCLVQKKETVKKVELKTEVIDSHKEIFSKKQYVPLKKKKKFNLATLSLIILSIISVICIVFMLVLTGNISIGFNDYVVVPDITKMTINDANDFLIDKGISIDTTNTVRELSDDVPANCIIKTYPEVGSKVDRGKKITVVVSDGQYQVLKNYIGSNITQVENELLKTKISIQKESVESDKEPGTIISQYPEPGAKYDENQTFNLQLQYSAYKSIELLISYRGMSVNDVKNALEEQGASVEIIVNSKDDFTSSEIATYSPNTVITAEPSLGTIYSQQDNNVIKLYCYGE